jgi:two-component sensor histidine kinase
MTADARDIRIAELEAEIKELRRLLGSAQNRAADDALATAQRSIHHAREMSTEREKTTAAELRSAAEGERADRAEARATGLDAVHKALFVDAEFNRQVLENTTDCITVLDLDGRLEFMNRGGMRVMEIDDFNPFRHCPWPELWQGEQRQKAKDAIAAAAAGGVEHFEGAAETTKGNLRWWEVLVTPILDENGRPRRLLSISRDITGRHEAELQRHLLFEEMHHRIKNTITNTIAITQQSLRNATDVKAASDAIYDRLIALGKAHDLLISNRWIGADLRSVVEAAVSAYVGKDARMTITGERIQMSSKAALTISMLVNELSTNATKYGAWSSGSGRVEISWTVQSDQFKFQWVEHSGPIVQKPADRSFGSRLIEEILPSALHAKASASYDPNGFVFKLEGPSAALTAN